MALFLGWLGDHGDEEPLQKPDRSSLHLAVGYQLLSPQEDDLLLSERLTLRHSILMASELPSIKPSS